MACPQTLCLYLSFQIDTFLSFQNKVLWIHVIPYFIHHFYAWCSFNVLFLSEWNRSFWTVSSAYQNEMWDKGILGRAKFLHCFCASQDPQRLHAGSQPDILASLPKSTWATSQFSCQSKGALYHCPCYLCHQVGLVALTKKQMRS